LSRNNRLFSASRVVAAGKTSLFSRHQAPNLGHDRRNFGNSPIFREFVPLIA